MDRMRGAALLAAMVGASLLAWAAFQGQVRLGIVVIFPVLWAEGAAGAFGILFLVLAAVLWFVGRVRVAAPAEPFSHEDWGEQPHRRTRSGGVMLIGPIPIVWGSDRRILPWMVVAGLVLVLVLAWITWARR